MLSRLTTKTIKKQSKKKNQGGKMKIKPLLDRVLLKPIQNQKTDLGIYVPKEATERSHIMKVIAIGDCVEINIGLGDCVIVSKYAGTEVIDDNEKLYVVNQYDILARLCEHSEAIANEPTKGESK